MWIELFKSIVPNSVLILAVAWLAKAITTNNLAKDLERDRADLQRSIEGFKQELAIEAHRRNTVFSRLHERRAEVIAEVYEALSNAEMAVAHYVISGSPVLPSGKTHREEAVSTMWTVMHTAEAHRIWFAPETALKIERIVSALRTAYNVGPVGKHSDKPQQNQMSDETIQRTLEEVSLTMYETRAALEVEFRQLLGVTFDSASAGAPIGAPTRL